VQLETHHVGAPGLCSHDTLIHLVNSSGTELTADDDSGVGTCSLVKTTAALPAGKYYVLVHEFGDNAMIEGYQLDFTTL
jgi:hypothetical protein